MMFRKNDLALVHLPDNDFWNGSIVKILEIYIGGRSYAAIYRVQIVIKNSATAHVGHRASLAYCHLRPYNVS